MLPPAQDQLLLRLVKDFHVCCQISVIWTAEFFLHLLAWLLVMNFNQFQKKTALTFHMICALHFLFMFSDLLPSTSSPKFSTFSMFYNNKIHRSSFCHLPILMSILSAKKKDLRPCPPSDLRQTKSLQVLFFFLEDISFALYQVPTTIQKKLRLKTKRDLQKLSLSLILNIVQLMFTCSLSKSLPFFICLFGLTLLKDFHLENHKSLRALCGSPFYTSKNIVFYRYEYQEDQSLIGEDQFAYDADWLNNQLKSCLEFWRGEREPSYAAEEERWKCNFCSFYSQCPANSKLDPPS